MKVGPWSAGKLKMIKDEVEALPKRNADDIIKELAEVNAELHSLVNAPSKKALLDSGSEAWAIAGYKEPISMFSDIWPKILRLDKEANDYILEALDKYDTDRSVKLTARKKELMAELQGEVCEVPRAVV